MTKTDVQQFITIIITVGVTVACLFFLQSCDDAFFGRPPDAYSQLR